MTRSASHCQQQSLVQVSFSDLQIARAWSSWKTQEKPTWNHGCSMLKAHDDSQKLHKAQRFSWGKLACLAKIGRTNKLCNTSFMSTAAYLAQRHISTSSHITCPGLQNILHILAAHCIEAILQSCQPSEADLQDRATDRNDRGKGLTIGSG